jgi:ribulose-5-phosphate 4-epimerase/fuculose-1-phosphate aldolase
MLVMEGLVAFSGHVSGRLPRRGTFLIHPAAVPRSEVFPADFCEVDLAGEQLSGPCAAPDETAIHAAVYRARRDVNAVLHLHPHYSILPSLVGKNLIPICGHGSIFGHRVPVYPRQEKIVRREDADRMAALLGEGRAVVLRGHGAVVAEGTVEAVFTAALYLEENARLLADALTIGTPIPMTDEELQAAYEETYLPASVAKTWGFYEQKGWKAGIFEGLKGTERS